MNNGGSAIRGSRIGSGPMGEQERGQKAERIDLVYYCMNGHEHARSFAASVDPAEIPLENDCPSCGYPAGIDKENPPMVAKHEPYKTHLAYVKERRSDEEAQQLLDEAVAAVRDRRIKLAQAAAAAAEL